MVPSLDVDPPHPVWYPRHSLKKELSERRPLSFICKLEDPIAARKAELCRKVRRARARQAPATSQNEAEQSYEAEDDGAGESERTTRAGRPRGGMKVAARIGEGLRELASEGGTANGAKRERKRRTAEFSIIISVGWLTCRPRPRLRPRDSRSGSGASSVTRLSRELALARVRRPPLALAAPCPAPAGR